MKALINTTFLALFVLATACGATTKTITGKVTDAKDSLSLLGVSVLVKGSKSGTTTDANGKYSIVVPDGSTLVFSYLGYIDQEVKVEDKLIIDIAMKPLHSALSEVVVIGYGVQEKRDITGSAASVAGLQGKVAGLSVRGNKPKSVRFTSPVLIQDQQALNTENYNAINENRFLTAKQNPLSTFGIDVDAASYSNVRRYVNNGSLPPVDAVRIEELINYFDYHYPQPTGDDPVSINTEISKAPWNTSHRLVKIGLQGKTISAENLPASNLVFLIDVSGSMSAPNKLPLVQSSMRLLTDQLREKDKVSIVVYAGAAGIVLKPTSGSRKQDIKDAINNLQAGGSTAGGEGIKLAYKTAVDNFIAGGNNRVILATDGDFNVGASSDAEMQRLVENEREKGVF